MGAVAGLISGAEPTGLGGIDHVWCAAMAGLGAFVGSYARRGPLLVTGCLAALFAPTSASLIPAAIAIVLAAAATADLARPTPFLRGSSAGASITSLLVASNHNRSVALVVAGWVLATAPVLLSGLRRTPEPIRRRITSGLLIVGTVVVLASAAAGLGAASARDDVDRGVTALRAGLAATRDGDLENAQEELLQASESLEAAAASVGRWGFVGRAVPGASQNVRALHSVLDDAHLAAARAGEVAGITDIEALSPDNGFLDLRLIEALAIPMNQLTTSLDIASSGIAGLVDEPLLPPIRSRLDELTPELDRALDEARTGSHAARVVPAMLGRHGPVRYLVLFTSPAEARGRYGFPAAYAIVAVDNGEFDLEVAESIGNLQESVAAEQSRMPLRDELVGPYIDYGATRNWRSVTVPPDFPTVATLAQELWRQTGTGEINGVLRVDTTSLAAFVQLTGPVPVEGRAAPLEASEVTRYLDFDQYVEFGDTGARQRREALEELAETVFDRLLRTDMPGPRGLADLFGPLSDEGHLQLTSFDEQGMEFLDSIGISGRFAPPSAPDALAVGSVNGTGNKIDAFLTRGIDYHAVVADDGTIDATVTLSLTNSAPASGLPEYVIGSALDVGAPPPGTNRTVQMVWSALPLVSAEIDGVATAAATNPTGGWWLHGVSLDIPPGATRTITLHLSGPPATDEPYRLQVLPGNLSTPDQLTVSVQRSGGTEQVAELTLREPTIVAL